MSITGKFAYYVYYQPKAWLNRVRSFGGWWNVLRIHRGRLALVQAAGALASQQLNPVGPEVYFLTGRKYWPETAFCLMSLLRTAPGPILPVFVDDGTMDTSLIAQIRQQFPGCKIKTEEEISALLNVYLPENEFPRIHQKRRVYPHLKKLTDVHVGSTGWKLVLDSDMLFFKQPRELLQWMAEPDRPFFLYDRVCSYHYSMELMQHLTGNAIMPNLNVGIVGLKGAMIDWKGIEHWIEQLETLEGKSYLLEQALSAMIVSGKALTIADPREYIVMPNQQEAQRPTGTLQHFVAGSKEWYYKTAWKKIR